MYQEAKYKDVREWEKRQTSGAVTILINSMLCKQEMSHPQIMSYLVGGGDHYSSHRYRILHFGAFERSVVKFWAQRSVVDGAENGGVELENEGANPAADRETWIYNNGKFTSAAHDRRDFLVALEIGVAPAKVGDAAFQPLRRLAYAERRIAIRRWAAGSAWTAEQRMRAVA